MCAWRQMRDRILQSLIRVRGNCEKLLFMEIG